MNAITLWQPWASLCVDPLGLPAPVKGFETRSWPAPASVIDQRLAIHAAVRPADGSPDAGLVLGGFSVWTVPANRSIGLLEPVSYIAPRHADGSVIMTTLQRGCVVGSVVVAECLPMVDASSSEASTPGRWLVIDSTRLELHIRTVTATRRAGFNRYLSIEHEDVSEQIPYGDFSSGRFGWRLVDPVLFGEPIPAAGAQRIWQWQPPSGCER